MVIVIWRYGDSGGNDDDASFGGRDVWAANGSGLMVQRVPVQPCQPYQCGSLHHSPSSGLLHPSSAARGVPGCPLKDPLLDPVARDQPRGP